MKKMYKVLSVALALGMGLSVLAGCGETAGTASGWLYGDGAPNATLGADGDLYLDNTTWDVYAKENGTWKSKGNIKGEQGEKGETGEQGEKGDKGDTGAQGPAGEKGEKGDTGAQGPAGEAGATGAQGPAGEAGAQGEKGEKGDTGAQGPAGAAGATGEKGEKGDTGAQGPAGAAGAKGEKGDTGAQGEKGNGWLYGNGIPDAELGTDGDLYLDLTTWDVYTRDGGAWKFRDNINSSSDYYKDFFPKFTMTSGKLKTCSTSDNGKNFTVQSIEGLFAQIGESKYFYGSVPAELTGYYGKEVEAVTIEDMITDYKTKFAAGYVLFDSANAESTNCARTISGAEQLVMVSKEAEETAKTTWGLTKVVDATEMTAKECFDQYKDKLSNKGLVYGDVNNTETGISASDGLTDFAIANRFFCYYPADKKEEGEERDPVLWSQKKPGTMREEDDEWKPLRHEVYEWCKGCPVYGGFPMSEVQTVKISAQYNSPVIVGSPQNLTVLGCVDFFGEYVLAQKNKFDPISDEKYPINKHYVTIVNADGDNLGVPMGTYEGATLMGADRGSFPMGWEMNPSLYALAPLYIRHHYNNAKAGDSFVCSISGFGHTFARYFDDRSLARLTDKVDEIIGACDLRVAKLLDDGSMFDEAEGRVLDAYTAMSNVEGLLYCTYDGAYIKDHGSVRWFNGKPVVSCRYTLWGGFDEPVTTQVQDSKGNMVTKIGVAERVNESSTDSTSIEAYSYVNLHIWSKNYNDVKTMVAAFDSDVQVVDPLTFIRLITQRVKHEDVKLTA